MTDTMDFTVDQCFIDLMGGPANAEALAAFAEGREPDFTNLPPGW